MRQKNLLPSLLLCTLLAFASCEGGQTNSNGVVAVTPTPTATAQATATSAPQTQEVTASVEEAKLDAGGAGEAAVRLDIAQGYHAHANPASDKFYVATEIKAEPQEGITPGKPAYPRGQMKKFSFSDKPLAVYEGSVVIKLPLRADKEAAKGRHTLRAKVRVQPCDDQVCKPPRDIDAPIPVTIN